MAKRIGNRGPRLGTKIMLLGLTLLVIPYFSYRQLIEMERLLVQGQSNAQLLTAEGISTLFNGREDLFDDLPVSSTQFESLYAHPLRSKIRIDGRNDDWDRQIRDQYLTFGELDGDEVLADGGFRLLIGERGDQLHVFARIRDDQLVYRDPEYLRLDQADHLRLSFIKADGDDGRLTITLPAPGVLTTYEMDPEWRFAEEGVPNKALQGFAARTDAGIDVEFRLPLALIGSRRNFGLAYLDVDDEQSRAIVHNTRTLPKAGKESFNLIVLRSSEVLEIIRGLGYSGARILVIDAQERVRAETGTVQPRTDTDDRRNWLEAGLARIRPFLHYVTTGEEWQPKPVDEEQAQEIASRAIRYALNGEPSTLRRPLTEDQDLIIATHPIVTQDKAVIGAIVVEQNMDEILSFQREALEQVIFLSIMSLFAVFIALLAFAGRLAWRIRNLRREASSVIDQYGRIRRSSLTSEMLAGDEIGDLARSVSNMLSKLHQHNNFLENMPRTLRHEINNPLNTLSTSLDNLAGEHDSVRDSKYLASAKRGVTRIGAIVQNLADAANLEESLQAEELEIIDIEELLGNYVANCRITHPNCAFVFRGTGGSVYSEVSDYRIEQLLDKIIDNAIDFHRANSPIKVQLDTHRDFLQISVANRGPILPSNAEKSLFDSMVSHRGPQNQLHFGLGLYVVRVIAEYHGGHVRAMNLTDGSGVAIMVQLPMARPEFDSNLTRTTRIETPARQAPVIAAR